MYTHECNINFIHQFKIICNYLQLILEVFLQLRVWHLGLNDNNSSTILSIQYLSLELS